MKRKTEHDNLEALLITVPQGKKPPEAKNLILRKKHPGGKNLTPQKKGAKQNQRA